MELCNSWQQEQLQASLACLDAKLQQLSVKLHGGTDGGTLGACAACTHCLVAVLHQGDANSLPSAFGGACTAPWTCEYCVLISACHNNLVPDQC